MPDPIKIQFQPGTTPAQIDTYFAGRTTVAQIKADVVDIVKVLALAIRD